ncbi:MULTISPECIES: hypothetical protein [unclassified Bradyrhizobium]|uniref:hypothetical protein n=1 Tax=unclassified Bradyrhizobium TaxID=2631580 RepID=UPI003399C868
MGDPAEQHPVDQAAELEVTVGDAIGLAFCRKSRTPAEKIEFDGLRQKNLIPALRQKRIKPESARGEAAPEA